MTSGPPSTSRAVERLIVRLLDLEPGHIYPDALLDASRTKAERRICDNPLYQSQGGDLRAGLRPVLGAAETGSAPGPPGRPRRPEH